MKGFKKYVLEEINMKVLSIQQPWAWLIANGYKNIENRKWKTNFRGECLIHASKKFDKDGYLFVKNEFPNINMPNEKDFQLGGIVGIMNIIDCVETSNSPWFFGPFGFVLKDSKTLDFIPCKGKLGFFYYNMEK